MASELLGYADKFSAMPGERICFMVSTDQPDYEVTIVRLIHGDNNPAGPGYKEAIVDAEVNRRYRGQKQEIHTGSYVIIEDNPVLGQLDSFTLQTWIYPTTPGKGEVQGLLTKWSKADKVGYGLYLGENGDLGFWLGDNSGQVEHIYTGKPLRAREWYFVAATFNADSQQVALYQRPLLRWPSDPSSIMVEKLVQMRGPGTDRSPLFIAAGYGEAVGTKRLVGKALYNGKIDSPRIFSRALSRSEIELLQQDTPVKDVTRSALIAAWDFSTDISSTKVTDTGQYRLHGRVVNTPARAVIGHNYANTQLDYKLAPHEYGAIHFHQDDLEDAAWEVGFEWVIPDQFKSGIYAARLRSSKLEDYIPFFVRPKRGTSTAPVAFLVPTMTYWVYGNQRVQTGGAHNSGVTDREIIPDPLDIYLTEHPGLGLSIYDHHFDGSGCMFSSRLRPILSMRPKYRYCLTGGPRHFGGDLYLVDWLEQKGFAYDVITDEDLHYEGEELLARYPVVMTGTHPEYWTTPMLAGLKKYLDNGGRLMYMGGNGFYWVTGVDAEQPHLVEVRRGIAGSRDWSSVPAECYLSTTGEMGGLWRHRGTAPNQLVGIGFAAMGWDGRAPGYVRSPGSFDDRAAFIFEGLAKDEIIGNFGLSLGGAAGDELDRIDYNLGTPPHLVVLASSTGHSQNILPVIEDFGQINSALMMNYADNVRADMVFFEREKGGAVFSTGSITWCGSLSHNNYNNNVSRITENVLRKFST